MKEKKTVELTEREWSLLETYIVMTTKHREKEQIAWEDLARVRDDEGAPMYKNAKANAEFWKNMDITVNLIKSKINKQVWGLDA